MMTRNEMRQDLVLLGVVAPFLAIIKPYGLYDGVSFLKGWLYWAGFMGVGSVLIRLSLHIFKQRLRTTHWLVASGLKTLIITPFIFGIILVSFYLKQAPIPSAFWPVIFGQIFIMSLAITALAGFILKARVSEGVDAPTKTFMQNLPIKYRTAELYAISAEDHYLRVHTSNGGPLILMRFKDALAELSPVQGVQTHRSWWVSVAGVADTRREKGRLSLVLKSGVSAPVSRTYMADVKEKGLQV